MVALPLGLSALEAFEHVCRCVLRALCEAQRLGISLTPPTHPHSAMYIVQLLVTPKAFLKDNFGAAGEDSFMCTTDVAVIMCQYSALVCRARASLV